MNPEPAMSAPSQQTAPQASGPREGLHTDPIEDLHTEEEIMKRVQARLAKAQNLSKEEMAERLDRYARATVSWREHDRISLRYINKGPGKPPREIANLTYRDRKTATAVAKGIEATVRATSTPLDFGAIKQKGRAQALRTTLQHLESTGEGGVVLQMDIQDFHPTIPHWAFREDQFGARQWVFIQKMLKQYGRAKGGSDRGIPQGSPISSLLASIAMANLLKELRDDTGFSTVITYADDITILDKDKANAMTSFARINTQLMKGGMSLHPEKLGYVEWVTGSTFELLGYTLTKEENGIQISCPERKFRRMKEGIPYRDKAKIRQYLQGWKSEFTPVTNKQQKAEFAQLAARLSLPWTSKEVLRPGFPGAPTPTQE